MLSDELQGAIVLDWQRETAFRIFLRRFKRGWNPAAFRTARATRNKAGQREATPTSAPTAAQHERAATDDDHGIPKVRGYRSIRLFWYLSPKPTGICRNCGKRFVGETKEDIEAQFRTRMPLGTT